MRKYLVINFILMVICIIVAVIMSFETVYYLINNQLRDIRESLILTMVYAINAYVCFINWKNELK